MTYRWHRPGRPCNSATFATNQEARDNAVFNAMIQGQRPGASDRAQSRYRRMTRNQKDLTWRSLQLAGWRIEAVV